MGSPPAFHSRWTGRRRFVFTTLTIVGAFSLYYSAWLQWQSLQSREVVVQPVVAAQEGSFDVAPPPTSLPAATAPPVLEGAAPQPTPQAAKPLPVETLARCSRTMLYKMSGLHGFASEFTRLLRVSLIAAHFNYSLVVDDSEWNYGVLQDYFEPFPMDCSLSKYALTQRRVAAGSGSDGRASLDDEVSATPRWANADHVKVRREIEYQDALFAKLFVDSKELKSMHDAELKTPIPRPPLNGNLTIPTLFLPVFETQAAMLAKLWRPNAALTLMIDELRSDLNLDQENANIVIAAHIRLGDKSKEIVNYGPQKWAPPGWRPVGGNKLSSLRWGKNRVSQYFEAANSLRQDLLTTKNIPVESRPLLLIMSDDTSAANQMTNAPQASNWTVVSVKQIFSRSQSFNDGGVLPTESSLKNGFSESQFNTMPVQSRINEARHFLRDLTVLGKYADGLIFTGSSNVSKLFALVGGTKSVSGPGEPRMRSMDVRWFPTGRYM